MRGCFLMFMSLLVFVAIMGLLVALTMPFFGVRVAHMSSPGISFGFAPLFPVLALALLLILFLFFLVGRVLQGGGSSRNDVRQEKADVKEIQDLHRGFEKLNERIEALETILINRK